MLAAGVVNSIAAISTSVNAAVAGAAPVCVLGLCFLVGPLMLVSGAFCSWTVGDTRATACGALASTEAFAGCVASAASVAGVSAFDDGSLACGANDSLNDSVIAAWVG